MKSLPLILISGLWLITSGISLSKLDGNLNGISDYWEKQYNNGELFPASFDPQADPDNDGWSNELEAAAGTDPKNANPPDGIVQPVTAYHPAVAGLADSVPVITVTWPILTGKQYTILLSPDLTEGTWLPVEEPFIAEGVENTYVFNELELADKRFWRVAVEDVDSDIDGLTDHEEYLEGTDPHLADSDYDGMDDHWEIVHHLNPHSWYDGYDDSDGDGIQNRDEYILGFHPTEANPGELTADRDTDGMPDLWEFKTGSYRWSDTVMQYIYKRALDWELHDAAGDYDYDGLTNFAEYQDNLNVADPDSDNDLLPDGWEDLYGFDPHTPSTATVLNADPDNDNFSNLIEAIMGTNPFVTNSHPPTPPGNTILGPPNVGGGNFPPAPPAPPSPNSSTAQWSFEAVTSSTSLPKHGYDEFSPSVPPKRYLKLLESVSFGLHGECAPPESPIDGTRLTTINAIDGTEEVDDRQHPDNDNMGGVTTARSPKVSLGVSQVTGYDDEPNSEGDCNATKTYTLKLLQENTTEQLIANTRAQLPDYQTSYESSRTPHAFRNMVDNEFSLAYQKCKYRIKWQSGTAEANRHRLAWFLVFQPETPTGQTASPAPIVIRSHQWDGASEISPEYEIDPETERPGEDGSYFLIPVEVEPDANMAGVIGDVVKSAITDSVIKHFVTPKADGPLNGPPLPIDQQYFVLKAVGVTADQITSEHENQIVEWDGGEEVPNEPLKRRVKRNTAAKTEVKIKAKQGGGVVAEMHVWVVWATITTTNGTPEFKEKPNPNGASKYEIIQEEDKVWRFKFKIEPFAICDPSLEEKPNLTGDSAKDVPGYENIFTADPSRGPADTAIRKWDVSRQMSVTLHNPNDIPKVQIQSLYNDVWARNQPVASDNPVVFPDLGAEGNDDPIANDENNNPYESKTGDAVNGNSLDHAIGEITSIDAPRFGAYSSWGAAGRTFAVKVNFREFARLEIWDGNRTTGTFWYRISDFSDWHHYFNTAFDGAQNLWKDAGSSSGNNHPQN